MLRFDPPNGAEYAEKCPGDGWISVAWQLLDAWKGARGYREISRDLGCSPGLLTLYKQGKTPAKPYLEKLESLADIPPIAWSWWVCLDPSKATANEPTAADPPESGSRSVAVDGKIGATIDELRTGVARLNGLLFKGKLSPTQVAQLEGKRISALTAIARLEERAKLEDHPEFAEHLDLILDALDETLRHFGLDPNGARRVWLDNLQRIEDEHKARKNAA